MTITIADGRGALWQWDTGRRLRVGSGVEQIHYQNRALGGSVDVDVGADGTAIIPDELLQDCHTLTAYVYVTDDTGAYTMEQQDFIVHKRAKPAGYVYTPTDQMTLQMIQSQIGDLADLTTEAKDTLVAAINEAARTGGGAGSMELRVADGYVQYSADGGMTWTNLIAMAELKGKDGITPTIGDNGNWYLGAEDTGKPSRGDTGPQGTPGIYYGTTPPTGDTHPVWIDPDGGPDDGGLLPAVTAADNGKVLRVVNSAWSASDMTTGGTDMGITGAAVGQIAKITAVDSDGKPTAWSPVDMPEALPNPNALTFTGAVTGSYDGSAPLSVEIPSGGETGTWNDVYPYTQLEEDISSFELTNLNAKMLRVYGRTRINDADNTLNSGSKRVAFFLDDDNYSALIAMYLRNSNIFYFDLLYDATSGVLRGQKLTSGSMQENNNINSLNQIEPIFKSVIQKLKISTTIDGAYFIKSGSYLGVKAYV